MSYLIFIFFIDYVVLLNKYVFLLSSYSTDGSIIIKLNIDGSCAILCSRGDIQTKV